MSTLRNPTVLGLYDLINSPQTKDLTLAIKGTDLSVNYTHSKRLYSMTTEDSVENLFTGDSVYYNNELTEKDAIEFPTRGPNAKDIHVVGIFIEAETVLSNKHITDLVNHYKDAKQDVTKENHYFVTKSGVEFTHYRSVYDLIRSVSEYTRGTIFIDDRKDLPSYISAVFGNTRQDLFNVERSEWLTLKSEKFSIEVYESQSQHRILKVYNKNILGIHSNVDTAKLKLRVSSFKGMPFCILIKNDVISTKSVVDYVVGLINDTNLNVTVLGGNHKKIDFKTHPFFNTVAVKYTPTIN
jgi:hypothetical protein